MVLPLSVTGIFKTILFIIGGLVLLRFLGQLMIAKRNMEAERDLTKRQNDIDKERSEKMKNFGKTNIIGSKHSSTSKSTPSNTHDVDFEEIV
ncbi:MAG: hypothetical protein V4638_10785 [Bacteroidota bacterium]